VLAHLEQLNKEIDAMQLKELPHPLHAVATKSNAGRHGEFNSTIQIGTNLIVCGLFDKRQSRSRDRKL
jgi:hypothetical protein